MYRSKSGLYLVVALIIICFAIRLLWLNDMEFKADEKDISQFIASLGARPMSATATPSYHSGFTPSSGFFYLVHWLSLGAAKPIILAATIAFFNAFAIALPLWFLRHSKIAILGFAFAATSMALVLGSRKIWNPDLVAAWTCLSAGLLAMAFEIKLKTLLLVLSGFALVMSAHMYLPGFLFAGTGTALALIIAVTIAEVRRMALTWLSGCLLGWLTFVPYFLTMLSNPAQFFGPSAATTDFSLDQLLAILKMEATLPSPYNIYLLYLKPGLTWLRTYYPSTLLELSVFWVILASFLQTVLFWLCVKRTITYRHEAIKNPIVLLALALLVSTPLALFLLRLGTYLHYWLGVLPFVYYWMAWAVTHEPTTKESKRLSSFSWLCVVLSMIATVHFLALVHHLKGLPGEYGPAYHTASK